MALLMELTRHAGALDMQVKQGDWDGADGFPHPFQRMWVRSSIAFYGNFNLDMDRSPGFGSTPTDYAPCSDLVSLRLRTFSP